jgi:peptidoglycan/xylan/chitin deacetylase (PgdA/CDA1 family)
VLAALRATRAHATFFVIAARAARHPELVGQTVREGHRVELHCDRHVRHTRATRQEIEGDTRRALATLHGLGLSPSRWRLPWGAAAPWSAEIARHHDLELCGWSLDTHDWRGDPASEMAERAAAGLVPDAIVLMHDGIGPGARRRDCAQTAALTLRLVRAARRRGIEPGPLGS